MNRKMRTKKFVNGFLEFDRTCGRVLCGLAAFVVSASVALAQDITVEVSFATTVKVCGQIYLPNSSCTEKITSNKYIKNTEQPRTPFKIRPGNSFNHLSLSGDQASVAKSYSKRIVCGRGPKNKYTRSVVLAFDFGDIVYEKWEVRREGSIGENIDCGSNVESVPRHCKMNPYLKNSGVGRRFWHGKLECVAPEQGVTYKIFLHRSGLDPLIYSLQFTGG